MAAITQNQPVRFNVNGSWRHQFYDVQASGNPGDTFVVGIQEVIFVDFVALSPATSALQSFSWTPNSAPASGNTITCQASAAGRFLVEVVGH